MRSLIYLILIANILFSANCKNKMVWVEPKSEIKPANVSHAELTANLNLIVYEKYSSININLKNNTDTSLFINEFCFPNDFLHVEKKVDGKFVNISRYFFQWGDYLMIDNIPLGEGDSTARSVLGEDYSSLNRQEWFNNEGKSKNLKDSLYQYFVEKEHLPEDCITSFLAFLIRIGQRQNLTYPVHINKTFQKGSLYKIYLNYDADLTINDNSAFCMFLFNRLPKIEGFKPYKGHIVSDTLYLKCE
jgi:hypothetical protein